MTYSETQQSQYKENVDKAEIDKFSAQAEQWWDPKGPLWTLHAINPLRLQFIDAYVNVSQQILLDVGCGAGLLSEALAYRGAKVTGLDMSSAVLSAARHHASEYDLEIDYVEQSIEVYAEQHKNSVDVVTCMEMLEHVPDPQAVIAAISHLLKPGGWAFLSTLNRRPTAFLQAIVGAEYILGMVPKGTHRYEKFIQPAELSKWCRASKLELIDMRGIRYNPFFKQFSISKNTDVNYLMAVRKQNVAE